MAASFYLVQFIYPKVARVVNDGLFLPCTVHVPSFYLAQVMYPKVARIVNDGLFLPCTVHVPLSGQRC